MECIPAITFENGVSGFSDSTDRDSASIEPLGPKEFAPVLPLGLCVLPEFFLRPAHRWFGGHGICGQSG